MTVAGDSFLATSIRFIGYNNNYSPKLQSNTVAAFNSVIPLLFHHLGWVIEASLDSCPTQNLITRSLLP